jgi:hypothetical protein
MDRCYAGNSVNRSKSANPQEKNSRLRQAVAQAKSNLEDASKQLRSVAQDKWLMEETPLEVQSAIVIGDGLRWNDAAGETFLTDTSADHVRPGCAGRFDFAVACLNDFVHQGLVQDLGILQSLRYVACYFGESFVLVHKSVNPFGLPD